MTINITQHPGNERLQKRSLRWNYGTETLKSEDQIKKLVMECE
jgi:hypothetical protein